MSILYVDLVSGNDSTGTGAAGFPYLTVNKALSIAGGPHDIRVAKTTAAASISANSYTWTYNSYTVTVNADVTGVIAVGDYIGKPTAAGNGAVETYYRVSARSYAGGVTTITLLNKYIGTTATVTNGLKQTAVTTGASNTTAITNNTSGTSISGGWNLSGSPVQDGETWFKPNGAASMYNGIIVSANTTISNMNILDAASCINNASTSISVVVSDSSLFGYTYAYIVYNATQKHTLTNCMLVGYNAVATYFGAFTSGSSLTNINIICRTIGMALNGNGLGQVSVRGDVTFSNVNIYGDTSGIWLYTSCTYLDLTGVTIHD